MAKKLSHGQETESPHPRPALKPLYRLWRIAGVGSAFVAFGLFVGLGIGYCLAPILRLRARLRGGTPEQRAAAVEIGVQRLIHLHYRWFLRYLRALGLVRVRSSGAGRVGPGVMLVANHPMLLDTVAVGALFEQADCIVSPTYARTFVLGGSIAAAGYLRSDLGPKLIGISARRLREGRTLLIYPEGTRSPAGGLGPFHRGTAHIALEADCDIVPVTITCEPRVLVKGQPWHRAAERLIEIHVHFGNPIRPQDFGLPSEPRARVVRRLTDALREHFLKELADPSGLGLQTAIAATKKGSGGNGLG